MRRIRAGGDPLLDWTSRDRAGDIMTELADWDTFCQIVGTAAATLMGLQFVALTLIASAPKRPAAEAGAVFSTPMVVCFGAALFLAAILRAPWHTVLPVAIIWGLIGVVGIVYTARVTMRMRSQRAYRPEFEDWLFHAGLPLMTYLVLVIAAVVAVSQARIALFGVGSSLLLLLAIGIHNAWDGVTYHVLHRSE